MHVISEDFSGSSAFFGNSIPKEADYGGETGAFYPAPGCFPPADSEERKYTVWFGGTYRENWSQDYVLSIEYFDRHSVQATFIGGRWQAVEGDRELLELLDSDNCPRLTKEYFQASASAAAAADECCRRGMNIQRLDESIYPSRNPLSAPELMRILMDDYGLKMYDAYDIAARCCNLSLKDIDRGELYKLQPRTVHVTMLLENCRENRLALLHDSRYYQYRSPFGALPCGTQLRLAFRVLGGKLSSASVLLYSDRMRREYPMERQGDIYSACFELPDTAAAMWYSFKIENSGEIHWLCPDASGYVGEVYEDEYAGFRLTVYKKDFATPDWFKGSIMYQVFPDRFAFSDDGTAERGIEYHKALGQTPELHAGIDEPVRYQPRPFEKNYSPDDFYGGTLKGIEQKLPYIKSLGISNIYLNPIVEARSNHRYDTSDYKKVDPILGSNEDFESLCKAAEEMGIRIILDGVFSHTGADSIYFNRYGNYDVKGACQGSVSEFYSWYDFKKFPDVYRSWWGFQDLPEVEERNPDWQNYIIKSDDSVVKTWLRCGAAGWRLDVADELPDEVLSLIRDAAKEEKPDALVLGEVWEDAVLKQSYGGRRNYALGYSLDSVMNYPFRNAAIDFIHRRINAYELRDFLISQQMNYPRPMYYCLMNLLGSHDVVRLRTAAALDVQYRNMNREQQLQIHCSEEELERALVLEKLCSALQYAIPSVPSLYYGDEQGMCGVSDPFNRQCFKESDCGLYSWYRDIAEFRNGNSAMSLGEAEFIAVSEDILAVLRWNHKGRDAFGGKADDNVCLCVINRGEREAEFEADCSAAGTGIYRGRVDALTAKYIKIK